MVFIWNYGFIHLCRRRSLRCEIGGIVMEINEKIDEIIQQAKEEGAYQDDFGAFEQEIYDQGFRNAIYFMLWNPSERSCSNCEYRYSRELCGEEYCGQKYWRPKLEE